MDRLKTKKKKTIIRAMHHIKCHAFRMNMLSIRRNKLNWKNSDCEHNALSMLKYRVPFQGIRT